MRNSLSMECLNVHNGFLEMGNKMSFQGFSLLFSEKRLQDFDVKIKSKKGLVSRISFIRFLATDIRRAGDV